MHVGKMDAPQDAGLANTDCHASESGVELVEDVALLGALLADDGALSAGIDECLHWVAIDSGVDVEHGYVSEELRVVLNRVFIVSLDHLLADFLLNHLLSFDIVRVGIAESNLTLLLGLLFVHDLLESVSDNFLDRPVIV